MSVFSSDRGSNDPAQNPLSHRILAAIVLDPLCLEDRGPLVDPSLGTAVKLPRGGPGSGLHHHSCDL
jgi:hypothetical protein